MKILLGLILLLGSLAQAKKLDPKRFELTDECKASVEEKALEQEQTYLKENGQVVAGKLEATLSMFFWPQKDQPARVSVRVLDQVDGRYTFYKTLITPESAKNCVISPKRSTGQSCRYSNAMDNEDGLDSIQGMSIESVKTVNADNAEPMESEQILLMLDNSDLQVAIDQTDEKVIEKYLIITPEGKRLDYFKYYAGDNPVGMMFVENTTEYAGDNSDDSICIGY
jgi:hypothetical protein